MNLRAWPAVGKVCQGSLGLNGHGPQQWRGGRGTRAVVAAATSATCALGQVQPVMNPAVQIWSGDQGEFDPPHLTHTQSK